MSASYYPVQLNLAGKACVVVGAGRVAARKAEALAACDASVTVIAPRVDPEIRALPNVRVQERDYRPGDLEGAWLVVAATDQEQTNAQVAADGERARIWVNVVDDPARSSFIVPAVLRRGPLTIGVSSAGASPKLAARLRDLIADALDPAYAGFAELLAQQRPHVLGQVPCAKRRGELLRRLAGDDVFQCFKHRGRDAAFAMMQRLAQDAAAPESP